MNVNYDRVCRLCLSSRGELLPIFPTTSSDDSEPPVLASKIKDCVSVQINENDELPTNVCRKCMDNVNNWHIFKTVCEKAQNKLQSLIKKDGSLLEEVKIKSEPFSDEAYDDGVVIHGSYPDLENTRAGSSTKLQPEGPPILASLGLTPRSDKGVESEKDEEEYDLEVATIEPPTPAKVPHMPEVSITVMRPSGETLHARQGIQQLASKDCLICGRSYRYSHNARRHELASHSFDRYTNKINKQRTHMQPKLRPNPFNPKARLMPNPISHKMQFMHNIPKNIPAKVIPQRLASPPKPIPIKASKAPQNNLPYPLRIKALKDLQIRKKEPQILKTLLTSKPEVLVSQPEIMNSGPESPETLISEPEIASFQVEAILSEPNEYEQNHEEEGDVQINQNQNYDTVDMESDHEIEIAREPGDEGEVVENNEENGHHEGELVDDAEHDDPEKQGESDDGRDHDADSQEHMEVDENHEAHLEDEGKDGDENEEGENEEQEISQEAEEHDEDEELAPAPVVQIHEEMQQNSSSEINEETNGEEEELDETADLGDTTVAETPLDPDKTYVTKAQRDFIVKYRNIIQQINTKRCLCCDKTYPRRKSVVQHLQKNGHKVPKHTCYNCVVTFGHIGALLSHMRQNACTDLWKIIYDENGISDDMVLEGEPRVKSQSKDIFNARSYACRLCPAKFQLKQSIMKHIMDVHEDGQSNVPFGCVHCRTSFKDRSLLKKHIRVGECTVSIQCELCTDRFLNMQEFSDHALTVHADHFEKAENEKKSIDTRVECPICGKKVSSYLSVVKHLKIVHGETRPHYCQNCDAKFEQASELNNHAYVAHSFQAQEPDMTLVKEEAEEYHYSCTECNAIFETVDAWTDHQVAEHNQVAHHCDQCDKKFLRPSELAEHKNTHLRVKFYPCSVCANSYSTPQKLSEHVQQCHPGAGSSASAETDFFCDLCIRSFKSRQAFSNHMRIHSKVPTTNRKPGELKGFDPRIIGKPIKQFTMAQPGFVNFKPNINVPNAPYSCDICGKGFMHKKNIWKHKKVLHADIINERNDSEENTMQASTEDDEHNVDENGALSTPQFNSFNFSNFANNSMQQTPQQDAMPFSCELCYKRFPLRTSLLKHKRAKHGIVNTGGNETQPSVAPGEGGRSSCTICKITFADKKSYYRHRKNVHKTATQMCKICGKPLSSTLELYEHLKAAHARELLGYNANQGSSKTQQQDVSQDMDGEYDNEQESADPSLDYQARYPCDTCGKQFVGLLALQNHQCINQLPQQPQTFDCEICHKSYTSIAALKSHRGWHLRSPDGKAAANNSGLWMPQHKVTNKVSKYEVVDAIQLAKVQHSTPASAAGKRRLPPEVEVTVVNPNKKMRSDDSVEMELQSNDALEGRYCTICDKEFTKRAAYQRHMDEVHQPNSVFCPVCDRSFTRKSTLLVHMKKHYEGGEAGSSTNAQMEEEEESFACDVCGVQCDSEKGLRAHHARHHAEDSGESEDDGNVPTIQPGEFTCGQCGDGVASPRDLLAHRSMHATPTKFFCIICKVYFARALDLSSHTRARHSDNDKVFFPCAMCDRFYMNKKSLQRHIEMAH